MIFFCDSDGRKAAEARAARGPAALAPAFAAILTSAAPRTAAQACGLFLWQEA
jgi:hypothetical protein